MQARSESDILAKAPLKVKLGEKDFSIPVLTVLAARAWRIQLNNSLGGIVANFRSTPEVDTKAFANGLTGALIQFPEKIIDLVFAYAPHLPKEELIGTEDAPGKATEEQFAHAFSAIMAVAYPFLPQLALARSAVLGSLAASPSSTSLQ